MIWSAAPEERLSKCFLLAYSIFNVVESAFNRRIQLFETKFANNQFPTLDAAFVHIGGPITRLIKHQLQQKFLLKFAIVLKTKYVKYEELGAIDEVVNVFLRSLSKPALIANINHSDRLVNCLLYTSPSPRD